jgi:hypothetical protein
MPLEVGGTPEKSGFGKRGRTVVKKCGFLLGIVVLFFIFGC